MLKVIDIVLEERPLVWEGLAVRCGCNPYSPLTKWDGSPQTAWVTLPFFGSPYINLLEIRRGDTTGFLRLYHPFSITVMPLSFTDSQYHT